MSETDCEFKVGDAVDVHCGTETLGDQTIRKILELPGGRKVALLEGRMGFIPVDHLSRGKQLRLFV